MTFAVTALVPAGLYVLRMNVGEAAVPLSPAGGPDPVARESLPPPPAQSVLFDNVQIVDVDGGRLLPASDLLVRGDRIEAIAAAIEPPSGALRVDGTGRYLMPGLVDSHVHVTDDAQLLLFLAGGVTTVQGLGGPIERNLDARRRLLRHEIAGPDYVSCDFVVRGGIDASEVDATVREAARAGVECIKIYSPPDWTSKGHAALIEAATRAGLRIGGHLPRNLSLDDGLAHGQQFVAHAEEFLYAHFNKLASPRDPAHIPAVVDRSRRSGAVMIPTLVAYQTIVEQVGPGITRLLARPELRHVAPEVREQWAPPLNRYRQRFTGEDGVFLGRAYDYQKLLVAAWAEAGVTLALGTDSSPQMPFVLPGFSALEEVQRLRDAGLQPAAILSAATVGGARVLGRSSTIGRVSVGYRADLLLLEGDPLDDVAHIARQAGVMVRGRWMPRDWLAPRLPDYSRR